MRAEGDHLIWDGGRLTRLHDGTLRFGADFFPDPRGAAMPREVLLPVHAYLLRRPGQAPVLIDSGSGTFEGAEGGGVARALAALGLGPDDIGAVCLTHLHTDHAGGLIAEGYGDGPVILSGQEARYWADRDHPASRMLRDKAARLHKVAEAEVPLPGLRVWALPGHTPGQIGFVIDDRIAVVGDMFHHAGIQVPDPGVATKYDVDPARALQTRRAALGRIAREGLVVCGGHACVPDGAAGSAFLRLVPDGARVMAVPA